MRVGGRLEARRAEAGAVDHEHLARLDVAHVLGADEVERRGLARDHVRVLVPRQDAEAERANAHRVAHRDHRVLGEEEERVGALHALERGGDAILDRDLLAHRDEVDEDLGVGRRLEDRSALLELLAELVGVREVSVVADGERALGVVDGERLRVLDVRAAGGRVADVTDGDAARQLREVLLAERVLDEAHRAVEVELLAVARDDARRLLAAVLERVQAEVREVRRLGVAVDAEDAALVAEMVVRLVSLREHRQMTVRNHRRRFSTFSRPTEATPIKTPRLTVET